MSLEVIFVSMEIICYPFDEIRKILNFSQESVVHVGEGREEKGT